jgi:uncharacterized membrane protein YcaP (DUF421 family)
MFFSDWDDLKRILVVGTLAYVALVLFLRMSGKRTLTKLNAFDLVITVALGSTLSAVLLDKSISLAEGVVAFSLLICLQYLITWTSVRVRLLERFVKSEPTLLLRRGQFLERAMREQRITRSEIISAIRNSGNSQLKDIAAVVIETDGSLSVVRQATNSDGALSQRPRLRARVTSRTGRCTLFETTKLRRRHGSEREPIRPR